MKRMGNLKNGAYTCIIIKIASRIREVRNFIEHLNHTILNLYRTYARGLLLYDS